MAPSISYPPIPILDVGPIGLSLHGVMAAVGFVVGAFLMIGEARRRGFDEEKIVSVLTWALFGSILGARLLTVPAHLGEGLIEALQPFKSFSIMGGFAGGILAGGWRMRMLRLPVGAHMDMAARGLAAGTVVGRIGDLLIVEHLGGRTDFALGYLIQPGYELAPMHRQLAEACVEPGLAVCGPYHHAALYDLVGAAVLFVALTVVARRWATIRYGVLVFLWAAWYGFQRFLVDFSRNTDYGLPGAYRDATLGPFTWNQWVGLVVGLSASAIIVGLVRTGRTPVVSAEQDAALRPGAPAR